MRREKRIPGQMQPLKGSKIPKRYLFFDTETSVPKIDNDIREFKLRLGVAIFIELNEDLSIRQRVEHRFKSSLEFIDIIKYHNRKSQLLHVFAHNIGFDVRVLNLPELFNDIGFTSEPPIINQMAFIWRIKSENGTFLFLDTANLGVRSVGNLGDDMGYPKIIVDLSTSDENLLFDYCIRDVDIICTFVIEYMKYIDNNGLGSFKVTLASQALCAFRTRFMYNPPHIHNHELAIKLERQSYHGGRVECFKIGKQEKRNYFYVDVNSMYPFAMKGNDLPTQFLGYSENVPLKHFKIRMKNHYVIADVLLSTDEPVYPYMPDDKLIFPIGKFRTTLHHSELKYALEHNHILKVYSSAQYKMGSIFDDYVDFFYAQKVEHKELGNLTLTTISKLFLNTGYGKLGQTEPIREFYGDSDFKGVLREPTLDRETNVHYQFIWWYGAIYKEFRQGETSFSCPYLAGAITAKARMLLWLYIKQAGRINTFYCDTDSLIVNARGYRAILQHVSKTRLGALKLETQSQCFELWGNKDYVFGESIKHKGIPTKATQIDQNTWEYLEFQGMIDWLNKGAKGAPKGEFRRKHRKSIYNKGIINANNSISPFTLAHGEGVSLLVV